MWYLLDLTILVSQLKKDASNYILDDQYKMTAEHNIGSRLQIPD